MVYLHAHTNLLDYRSKLRKEDFFWQFKKKVSLDVWSLKTA